jgi:DUF971 family protein
MKMPERVELDAAAHTLTLHWPGAATPQRFSHAALRHACPCVQCRRERLMSFSVREPDGVLLLEMRSVGDGMRLVFSDGHAQGIFPWPYLENVVEHLVE